MIVCQFIKGFSVGIEYYDDEDAGFLVNADLGLIRITWYKDLDPTDWPQ